MVIHYNGFLRKFLRFSFIGIIFLISCSQGKVEQDTDADEWFVKLGFKEVMEGMRKDTRSLSGKIKREEWEDAKSLCNKISSSFNQLDLGSSEIPEGFSEFKEEFNNAMSKLLLVCGEKELTAARAKLDVVKRSCRSCHLIYRKELDVFNKETDHGVAMERFYKDRDKD
ncbi:MAG: cytochrome c [Candidatus Scalindua sp.]|nr:cytochrome c [Candidatus Scalindua sp.]